VSALDAAARPVPAAAEPRPRRRRPMRTPVVPQMEEQDCGAACLAIVLGGFGRRISLHEARHACGVSRDGVSAAAVGRAAGAYGVDARGRRVTAREGERKSDQIAVPAMVLLDGPHFVVFEGVRRGRVLVNDPSSGRYAMPADEFEQRFLGVALEFTARPDFVAARRRLPFARELAARVRPYAAPLSAAVAAAVLVAGPAVLAALVLRVYLTQVVALGSDGWALACTIAVAFAALTVIAGTWLQQRALAQTLVAMSVRSSADFTWRLLRLPGEFFHLRQLGGLVTRVQLNDGLAVLLTSRLAAAVAAGLTGSIALGTLVWLDPQLSLVAVGVAAVNAIALRMVARRRTNDQHRLQMEEYRRDGVAFAGIAAIETLKAEGAEDTLFSSWAGWQARALNTSQELAARVQALLVVPSALNVAAGGLVVVLGARQLLHGDVSLGTLLAFQLLMSTFLLPITSLVGLGAELLIARAQLALLDDVLEAEVDPYLQPILAAEDAPRLAGSLELREVTFGYDRNRPPLVNGLSLAAAPGERVAVVGATGSGKSTLARLAAGVLQPWAGEVLYDGRVRAEVPRAVLTTSVAYVEQQLRLFEGTVRDNLTLWDPTVEDDRLADALADAGLTDVIARRGGLDAAWVAEDAANLSGGERQRLELARALVLDPAILILDEATSALDSDTELHVDARLRARGCTSLVFAHRLSTVRDADQIVVLDAGRIVQQGRHEELLAVDGPYRALVEDLR
jgi:NHLM bacteriocin system ABC transporter peptidase/ATP-binding protein